MNQETKEVLLVKLQESIAKVSKMTPAASRTYVNDRLRSVRDTIEAEVVDEPEPEPTPDPVPDPPPDSNTAFGVYVGAADSTEAKQFETWVPRKVEHVLDFLTKDMKNVANPDYWVNGWKGKGYQVTYSLPLCPVGTTPETTLRGYYDDAFVGFAQHVKDAGQGDCVIRLGWEFNGSWYPWFAKPDPATFADAWRRVVQVMREVAPDLRFDWCRTRGGAMSEIELGAAFPGAAFVDIIGIDSYDQSWVTGYTDPVTRWTKDIRPALDAHAAFARARGKPISLPEWGLTKRSDGHGGGDCPYFIEQMAAWIAANDVAYHCYFEFDAPDGAHKLMSGQFPKAAAAFKAAFHG